ncbi:hypothetical protein ABPG72_002081 [Tetrahymena utriculariae]
MNLQELKNFQTKNIEIPTKFQLSRSYSPKKNRNQVKLSPLLIPKGQNDQLSEYCVISDINIIQKHQDTLKQYCNNSRINEQNSYKNSELQSLSKTELNQSENFLKLSNKDFDSHTSTFSSNLGQIKTVNTKLFKRNIKYINCIEQESDKSKEYKNYLGDECQEQAQITLEIKKCVSIYEGQKNKSIEKRSSVKEFVKNLIKILNLMILADSQNIKKQYERVKQDIFQDLKSLIFCNDSYINQVVSCIYSDSQQLCYQDICNLLAKRIQNIDNNNSFYSLQQSQQFSEALSTSYQNFEKFTVKRDSFLENKEIARLKQEIQIYQNQKNQFILELDNLQEKFKLQSDKINILYLQMHKDKKQSDEKHQIQKKQQNQLIQQLEDKLKQIETSKEDLKIKQQQLCSFISNLLIIIDNLNQTIQSQENDFLQTKSDTQKIKDINHSSFQTKQQTPNIPQDIQILLVQQKQ